MSRILTLSYSFLFLRRFICTLAKFAIFFTLISMISQILQICFYKQLFLNVLCDLAVIICGISDICVPILFSR